jgi:outer membrane protein TolC
VQANANIGVAKAQFFPSALALRYGRNQYKQLKGIVESKTSTTMRSAH